MQILDPYTTYGWPLLVALAFALVLAQYAWRRRTMPGALPFIGMMACGSAWLAVSVLQTISTDFLVKVRWHQARDVVALLVASASLYFAVAYARLSKWQSPRTYLLLAAVPVVYALFNLTNEAHHLVWARVWVDTSGIIRDDLGPVKLIAASYGYLLVMLTWAILAWLFIRSPAHRGAVGMLLVAQIATRVAYVMHATSRGLVASLEPVILVSVLGYIIYFLAIFRLGGFDLVPSARGTAFARMSEGVLVLDDRNLIVEMNPMAETLLGAERANLIDRDAAGLRVISSDLVQAICATVGHVEVELETCVPRRSLAVTVSPLHYDGGRRNGRLVLLRDITEHKRAERRLEQRNSELEGIFQALPDLYFRLASDGVILDYRAGQAADLYLSPQEFVGRRMQDVLPPETGRLLDEARRETLTTQTVVSLEYSLPMAGGIRHFEARLLPLLSDQVILVVRNVTERKESDEALRRAYEDMERRVAERTVELQQANEALNLENIERQRAEVALRTLNATLGGAGQRPDAGVRRIVRSVGGGQHGSRACPNSWRLHWA